MRLSELIEEEFHNNWIDHENHDTPAAVDDITARLHECVKPLEWVDSYGVLRAATPFGDYMVTGKILTLPLPMKPQQVHADEEAAKAAAQAHYAKQIIEGFNL